MSFRERGFFKQLARRMGDAGIRPNTVSVAGALITGIGSALLIACRNFATDFLPVCLLVFPLFIFLRSICNLIDGMIAVEGGKLTKSGEIFNDFPDRVSDPLMLVAVGYAIGEPSWGVYLGWAAALAAVIVAYTRVLGAAAGARHYFIGPMAKTHRMVVVSIACFAGGIEQIYNGGSWSLVVGLLVVIAGCAVTIVRRLRRIVGELETR